MQLAPQSIRAVLSLLALCVLSFAAGGRAHAQTQRVAVLTLSDDAVSEDVAAAITDALRSAVKAAKDYSLSDAHASLDQLSMANDCDPGAVACLQQIAKGLSVDGLVYGAFGGKAKSGLFIEVKYFEVDAAPSATQKRATYSFESATPSNQDVRHAADGLIAELFGLAAPAVAPVENTDAAEAPPWPEDVAKAKPSARDVADEQAASSGVSGRRIAAYSLIGVAIASAGMSALSFVQVGRADKNPSLHDYRVAVGEQAPMVRDACKEAETGNMHGLSAKNFATAKDSCSTGNTYEALQFVFLGAAVVSGGLGAFLLVRDDAAIRDHARKESAFALRPMIGLSSASLTARFAF